MALQEMDHLHREWPLKPEVDLKYKLTWLLTATGRGPVCSCAGSRTFTGDRLTGMCPKCAERYIIIIEMGEMEEMEEVLHRC